MDVKRLTLSNNQRQKPLLADECHCLGPLKKRVCRQVRENLYFDDQIMAWQQTVTAHVHQYHQHIVSDRTAGTVFQNLCNICKQMDLLHGVLTIGPEICGMVHQRRISKLVMTRSPSLQAVYAEYSKDMFLTLRTNYE